MKIKNLNRKTVENIYAIYADAWINRDPEKIITIFTPGAVYHEYFFKKPFVGHAEIKKYWKKVVAGEQSDIHFKLINIYIDGATAISEWEADFFNNKEQKRIYIREVEIMEIVNGKVKSLREYWHSKRA